jgi:hypothetical protein
MVLGSNPADYRRWRTQYSAVQALRGSGSDLFFGVMAFLQTQKLQAQREPAWSTGGDRPGGGHGARGRCSYERRGATAVRTRHH